jgi:hypothetical protein
VGRSRLQCNDITFAAWRRVTRSRCGVVTRAMRRLPESKSDSLEHFGRSGVTPTYQPRAKSIPRAEKRPWC